MSDLNGKIALVTGGGRGLGEAICRNLAGAGAQIVAGDVRVEMAERVAESILESGGRAEAIRIDVTDEMGPPKRWSGSSPSMAQSTFLSKTRAWI